LARTLATPLPWSRAKARVATLNYLEYVKDFDSNVHVKVFKAIIKANSETNDAKFVNLFSFTLKDILFI